MGIKIKKAWNMILKTEILISDATDEMRKLKQFCCNPVNCDAKLTWAERHKKNFNLGTKFYRLLQNETHSSICEYNTEGRLISIAKKSNKKILENISSGKYEFRINLIFEKESKEESKLYTKEERINEVNTTSKDRKIVSKGQKSPYLSTMIDIMKLRTQVEENKDISSLIKLKFNGNTIPWKNFYFELEEEDFCFNYIKSKGYDLKNGRKMINHLICTEFILRKDGISKYNDTYFIESTSKYVIPNSNNESHIHKISLKTKENKVVEKIESLFTDKVTKLKLVGFYKPSILIKSKTYKTKNGINVFHHNIDGWINNKEQLIEIETFANNV